MAYNDALNTVVNKNTDGILEPRYSYKKTSVLLLLFGWRKDRVTAEGKAFRIKTEEEYQSSRK